MLSIAHGDELAETATARGPGNRHPHWQPLRKAIEELLIAYDWGEAFTALNLAVKPMVDALVNEQLGALAAANGDQFLAQLLAEFDLDSKRSQDWSQALVAYAVDRDPALTAVLDGWLARWQPTAKSGIDSLATLFASAPHPMPAASVSDNVARRYANVIDECGLTVHTQAPA